MEMARSFRHEVNLIVGLISLHMVVSALRARFQRLLLIGRSPSIELHLTI